MVKEIGTKRLADYFCHLSAVGEMISAAVQNYAFSNQNKAAVDVSADNPQRQNEYEISRAEAEEQKAVAKTYFKINTSIPGLTRSEDKSRKLTAVSGEMGCLVNDSEKLLHKMGQITSIEKRMEKKMSGFGDSDVYKEMIDSMKTVRTQLLLYRNCEKGRKIHALSDAELKRSRELLETVQKKSIAYLDARTSTRSSEKGKKRVDAALLAVAVTNADAAMLVQDTVNEYREKDRTPRFLDCNCIAEEYGILLDEPKYYSSCQKLL